MNRNELFKQIKKKRSFLCIGLDSELSKIPKCILDQDLELPLLEFNKQIIDATAKYVVAYKPNTAFYEALGSNGWLSLELTIDYIKHNHPNIYIIADGKRGDIGNTSKMYAKAFFETMGVDAVTVAPYMGIDSVSPFLDYKDKWTILLNLTSNTGSYDLQTLHIEENGMLVHEHMLKKAINEWGATPKNSMFVVGATKAEYIGDIRKIVPDHFLLVPGVGAQGGSLEEVAKFGLNKQCGLIVNNSRAIIYAGNGEDFAQMSGKLAMETQQQMEILLRANKLI